MTDYLLDTNVFIEAKNRYYGFDFCPAFWEWLDEQNHAGKVASIKKVADELHKGGDELAEWAKDRGDSFFLRPDEAVMSAFSAVSNWANASEQNYERSAVATFLQIADYYLVAHALAHKCTVVTHEVHANTTKKIKIPNACIGLGIRCMNLYEMLSREKARFVLGPGGEVA